MVARHIHYHYHFYVPPWRYSSNELLVGRAFKTFYRLLIKIIILGSISVYVYIIKYLHSYGLMSSVDTNIWRSRENNPTESHNSFDNDYISTILTEIITVGNTEYLLQVEYKAEYREKRRAVVFYLDRGSVFIGQLFMLFNLCKCFQK